MSNVELPVLRKRALDGNKRLRRLVPLVAAAALSTSLIAGAAGPASAVGRQPARTAPISLASSGNTLPAAAKDTTITVLPGITLTIKSTGIQLSMTKQAVTEVENVVGFGQSVASLVGAILGATPASLGSPIAGIVASSLGLGNGLLKFCTASNGSATFTIPWFGLPSCSGSARLA